MNICQRNVYSSLSFTLTVLKLAGIWTREKYSEKEEMCLNLYRIAVFMFATGSFIIIQVGDLIQSSGDVSVMTATLFLLFANLALTLKLLNIVLRRGTIITLIDEADQALREERRKEGLLIVERINVEAQRLLILNIFLGGVTLLGWAAGAGKGKLPFRAWYPYDVTKSPVYEITYAHQIAGITLGAFLNISVDTLVTSLVAQCRCRLELLRLSLTTLCRGMRINLRGITSRQEATILCRLQNCVVHHQSVLKAVVHLQDTFSETILVQFVVSVGIICVTAYQLAFDNKNLIRVVSMVAYLLIMVLEVFIYCYQSNELLTESAEVLTAAYEFPWYLCSLKVKRALLVLMTRSRRFARLTAGGFTTLSLALFMTIIRTSYTFFNMLRQVQDRR